MTTLLIDASHFMHRIARAAEAVRAGHGEKFDFRGDPAADRLAFLDRAVDSICSEWRKGRFDRIVYCMDSFSWRKEVFDGYKAGRKRDSEIDWKSLMEVHEEFARSLGKTGVTISKQRGAEADDLVYAWVTHLNGWGDRDCVILSGDGDLSQLVGRDRSNGHWTVQVDRNKKVAFVPVGHARWMQEEPAGGVDIFNLPTRSDGREFLAEYLRGMETVEIDPTRYVFCKILTGDSGDSIPSVHSVPKSTKAGDRVYGFTLTMAHRVLSAIEDDHMMVNQLDFFSDDFIKRVCELAAAEASERLSPVTSESIEELWRRNRDLVFLHRSCILPSVCEAMEAECAIPAQAVHEISPPVLFDFLGMGGPPPEASKEPPAGSFDSGKWKNMLG
mgnify:CR=1 FL=1